MRQSPIFILKDSNHFTFFFFFFTVSPAYRVSNTGENENPKIYKNAAITTSLTVHSHPVKENRVDLCIICNKIFINAQHMWGWSNEYFQFSYFATWEWLQAIFLHLKAKEKNFKDHLVEFFLLFFFTFFLGSWAGCF